MTAEHAELRDRAARYITGSLPPAEAQQLEARFRADPQLGEQLGIGLRLARLYRLLEIDRAPEPEPPRWQSPRVLLGGAIAVAVLALALVLVAWRWSIASDLADQLEARIEHGLLQPASETHRLLLDPESGKAARLLVGDGATRVDLQVLIRSDRFNVFRVTLARSDGATALVANRLQRDSNGHLGLSFNTSVLPPDDYRVIVEGINYRGETSRLARASFQVERAD